MSIPNEHLKSVSHNRQFPELADRVSTSPTGIRADSDAGGGVAPSKFRSDLAKPAHGGK